MRDVTDTPDLGQALGLAAGIFSAAQGGVSVPSPTPAPDAQPQAAPLPSNEELADRLAKLFAEKEASAPASPTGTPADAPPSPEISDDPPPSGSALDSLAAILPPLLQAFSGNGDLVKPEKLNLIRAFQPYLSSQRSPNIDRAIKMANIALAAKSAISVLGR